VAETVSTPELSFNLAYWGLQTIAMLITAFLIPGLRITGIFGALFIVIALAFVNSSLWDAALFFQIPNHLTTQALLLFIANGFIFWLLAKLLPGIEIDGLLPALAAPIIFTLCSIAIDRYGDRIPWAAIWEFIQALFIKLKELVNSPSGSPHAG
jgi:putative membrane protein